MFKYINNNKGSTLVMLLIAMVVLVVLGTSLLNVSLAEANQAVRQENNTKAHYVARSGAEIVANAILEDQLILSDYTYTGTINGNNYKVFVENVHDNKVFKLHALGTSNNRTEDVFLTIAKGDTFFEHAIFGDEVLGLGGSHNTTVKGGNVATNAVTHTGNITFIPSDNEVKHEEGFDLDPIATDFYEDNENVTYISEIDNNTEDIILSDLPSYEDNENGDPKVLIYTDNFTLTGNSSLKVIGPGELHLLVKESFTMSGNPYFGSDTPNTKIYLDYNGTSDLTFNGHLNIDGYVYAPNSTININGGVGTIKGSITSKKIDINGGNFTVEFNSEISVDTIDVKLRKQEWSNI